MSGVANTGNHSLINNSVSALSEDMQAAVQASKELLEELYQGKSVEIITFTEKAEIVGEALARVDETPSMKGKILNSLRQWVWLHFKSYLTTL
mgnify:CR=1 FL=1